MQERILRLDNMGMNPYNVKFLKRISMMKGNRMNQNVQPQQINLELGEKEAEGIYSNFVVISHSPAEFVLDFTRMLPGVPKAKVYARVIMTPQHAKSLLRALNENIEKFEKQYGEIKITGGEAGKPFGFQTPASTKPKSS